MGFRFQRRINLGGGWGLNASKSGGSLSYRSQRGSIGTKGFSLRTGVPGLTYRRSWGKNAGGAALIVLAVMVAFGTLAIALRIVLFVLPLLWNCLAWIVLTLYDLCVYGVGRLKMRRSHPAAPQNSALQNSNGTSHVRDAVIGITVCGAVYLLFSHLTSKAPSTPAESSATASRRNIPNARTQASVAAPTKTSHPRRINASPPAAARVKKITSAREADTLPAKSVPPPQNDDLVDVRMTDPAAAARIDTYCAGATAQATSRQDEILARCWREESAAWRRLFLQNEFPSLTPAIRETCTSPPFPESFVAEEVCARYETHSDLAR